MDIGYKGLDSHFESEALNTTSSLSLSSRFYRKSSTKVGNQSCSLFEMFHHCNQEENATTYIDYRDLYICFLRFLLVATKA